MNTENLIQNLLILVLVFAVVFVIVLSTYIFLINKYGHEIFLKTSIGVELRNHHSSYTEITEEEFHGFPINTITKESRNKILIFKWSEKIEEVDLRKLLASAFREKGYTVSLEAKISHAVQAFLLVNKVGTFSIGILKGSRVPNSFLLRMEYIS